MFSKPKNGWTEITIKDDVFEYKAPASYITNIPDDCLDTFIYALKNHCSVVIDFDAEGWEYKLVCSGYDTYIIEDKDEYKVYHFNITLNKLVKEFLDDLESYIKDWVLWNCCDDEETIISDILYDIYIDKINELKELLLYKERKNKNGIRKEI